MRCILGACADAAPMLCTGQLERNRAVHPPARPCWQAPTLHGKGAALACVMVLHD